MTSDVREYQGECLGTKGTGFVTTDVRNRLLKKEHTVPE